MKNQTFENGQKVKNHLGEILTVRLHDGCCVFVYEECNSWYHPANIFAV